MRKHKQLGLTMAATATLMPGLASASGKDLELVIAGYSIQAVTWGSLILLALIGIAALTKSRSNVIFGAIAITVFGVSTFLIGSTIYLNQNSSSKGPVHWHADTEVWACGEELQYADPVGRFSNKIGTSTLHEHNDKRIHLEGVVVAPQDASLSKFFRVIDGQLTSSTLVMPTNEGPKSFVNGQWCRGIPSEVQVFVYKTTSDMRYTQEKVANPARYIISPDSNVPPADCIIIEFSPPKDRTDKICRSYKVAEQIGRLKGPK